ncbi:uncharacterized protein METZ01_LOCUS233915, partial [marine metagenome]
SPIQFEIMVLELHHHHSQKLSR